jgi:hypothetical protein
MPGRQCLEHPFSVLSKLDPAHQYMSHLTLRFFPYILYHRPPLRKGLSKCLTPHSAY